MKSLDVRTGKLIVMLIVNSDKDSTCKLQISTESMETASDIIQDFLGNHLKVTHLLSQCSFPDDMTYLNDEILKKINETT